MAMPIELRDDEGLVTNAADPAQVERATFVTGQNEAQALNDVRAVMSTREGRRAVRRWLGLHGLYKSITAIESSALTYALSGRRDAGLEMLEDVTADGTLFLAMENEHREDAALQARIAAARRAATREEDDLDVAV